MAIVLNFFAGGIQTLIAPYSKITINGNASTYGTMLAALSLGTVVGSVVVGKIETRKYVGRMLFAAVTGLGGSIALIGLTTNVFVAVGLMFALGLFLAFANLPLQTMIQAKVPGNLLGRVFTSLGAIVTVATPVAAITTGSLAGSLMIGPTLLLYGSAMILVTVVAYFAFREVREAKY